MKVLLQEYWKVILKSKWSFLGLLLLITAVNFLEVLVPLYYKEIANLFGVTVTNDGVGALWDAFIAIAFCYGGIWIAWRFFDFCFLIPHQIGGMRDLTKAGFQSLKQQKYIFFQNEFSGKLVKKVSKFSSSFEHTSDWFLFNFYHSFILIIFTFSAFYSQSNTFAYIFLAWVIIFLIFTTGFAFVQYKYNKIAAQSDSIVGGAFADTFSNVFTVKASGIENQEQSLVYSLIDDNYKKTRTAWLLSFFMFSVQGVLSFGIQLYLISLMIEQWELGLFEVGQFILFQTLILFVIQRVWEFGRSLRNLFGSLADGSEMAEIMSRRDVEKDSSSALPHKITKGEIEFRDMGFGYEETSPPDKGRINQLFSNFNFTIPAGQKVALVGHSGSGKTTLTNLLFRFFDPQKGGIYFDGINASDFTYQSLRSQISLVPQHPEMFHRTLRENIILGKEVSDEEIWKALKKAQGYDFAKALSEGLDTMIGERGVKLSGGEKQRVAIARAFLEDSPIVVLDEATSALDSITESELQKGIFQLIEQKTSIVIAHRLSTVLKMDRIIVLDKGEIIEEGSHQELLAKGGKYSSMWEHQRGGFLGEE